MKKTYGVAAGASSHPLFPSGEIWIYPDAYASGDWGSLCTPKHLAKAFVILAHETLHFCCAPHSGGSSGGSADSGNPPPTSPPDPIIDCNDLNYKLQTAKAVAGEIASVGACCSGSGDGSPDDGDSDDTGGDDTGGGDTDDGGDQEDEGDLDGAEPEPCPGLLDENGDLIEGLSAADLEEYCKALVEDYEKMQAKYNTADYADIAQECACGSPPWIPGPSPDGDVCCPNFPTPPGGCGSSAQASWPDNELIPDLPPDPCSDC